MELVREAEMWAHWGEVARSHGDRFVLSGGDGDLVARVVAAVADQARERSLHAARLERALRASAAEFAQVDADVVRLFATGGAWGPSGRRCWR